jgi:hypothetical protein
MVVNRFVFFVLLFAVHFPGGLSRGFQVRLLRTFRTDRTQ